jgi:hypothetical protein
MAELASTKLARMYHSEASLMLGESAIVSGSDPEGFDFSEECLVEHFSPHLLSGPGFVPLHQGLDIQDMLSDHRERDVNSLVKHGHCTRGR